MQKQISDPDTIKGTPEGYVEAITIECTSFNTHETFCYLIYLQGNLKTRFVKINRMFLNVHAHTHTQIDFPPSLIICLSFQANTLSVQAHLI